MNQRSSCQHNTPASSALLHYVITPLVLNWLRCECILEICCLYQFCPRKFVPSTLMLYWAQEMSVTSRIISQSSNVNFYYPGWGLSNLTEVFLAWLKFFYPDWSFSTLTEVFLPWLRFFYPDWCFSTLAEVFYPDWGFSTLTEVFLPLLRFF